MRRPVLSPPLQRAVTQSLVFLLLALSGAAETIHAPLVEIPLAGPAAAPTSELSGLAWHGSQLVLLAEEARSGLFLLERDALLAVINGQSTTPLKPALLPLTNPEVLHAIPSFDGLEALAFRGDTLFLVAESRSPGKMEAYLLKGVFNSNPPGITLDTTPPLAVGLSHQTDNFSVESLVLSGDNLILIEEANGRNVSPAPKAQVFSPLLARLDPMPLPNIEYRVTDATPPDAEGRFWVTNYLWPPERYKLQPAADGLDDATPVEQLLELRLEASGIARTETLPINLRANEPASAKPRNWEGIARLDDRGFLVVTDAFPRTILAFVPAPAAH